MIQGKDYQLRDKFFYAVPSLFPKWDYPSRLAIGVKLSDARFRNSPVFRFKVNGKFYEIGRESAIKLGNKYRLLYGKLPNLIPLEEFKKVKVIDYLSNKSGVPRVKWNKKEYEEKEHNRAVLIAKAERKSFI